MTVGSDLSGSVYTSEFGSHVLRSCLHSVDGSGEQDGRRGWKNCNCLAQEQSWDPERVEIAVVEARPTLQLFRSGSKPKSECILNFSDVQAIVSQNRVCATLLIPITESWGKIVMRTENLNSPVEKREISLNTYCILVILLRSSGPSPNSARDKFRIGWRKGDRGPGIEGDVGRNKICLKICSNEFSTKASTCCSSSK